MKRRQVVIAMTLMAITGGCQAIALQVPWLEYPGLQAAAFIRREPTICLELPYQHSNVNARHTPVLISATSLVTARSHRLWQRQLGFVRIRYVKWALIFNVNAKLTLFCRTFLRPPSIDASPEQLPYCWQYATQNHSSWANGTLVSRYYFKPKNYI